MFRISTEPLEPAVLQQVLLDKSAGACVTFEGWVRSLNEGLPVIALEYEAYITLAEKEGSLILEEARGKYDILGAVCLHRVGRLQLGEAAVWVGVAAEHRGAAFDACRYIIDETKARVPIWKKEYYDGGATTWINGATRGRHASAAEPEPGRNL